MTSSPSSPLPPRPIPRSPQHDGLRALLAEATARVLGVSAPADQFLGGFLRRRGMGGAARGFLGAALFALLRARLRTLLLDACCGRTAPPEHVPLLPVDPAREAALGLYRWLHEDLAAPRAEALEIVAAALALARAATPLAGEEPVAWPEAAAVEDFAARVEADPTLQHCGEPFAGAAAHSLPVEVWGRWVARFGADRAAGLGRAMPRPAPLDLRVHLHRTSREDVLASLRGAGIEAEASPWSPAGIRLARKAALNDVEARKAGWIEIQDEASQLVSLAVDPPPGAQVLDFCAGAGGKTVHLAGLLHSSGGVVVAHDREPERMKPLLPRVEAAGLHNVQVAGPGQLPAGTLYAAVLVDAPCLGFGRLRREPSVAWRGDLTERLRTIPTEQLLCLLGGARHVAPGGVLVYATCSFEPEENDALVARFLAERPDFRREALPALFQVPGLASARSADGCAVTLLPSEHGTDGFHIARLRRAE